MKYVISILLMCFVISSVSQAQESVSTAGGKATSNSGSVSYTVGQVAYSTHSSNSGTIMEGVQQAYEIFIISTVDEKKFAGIKLKAYPNPVDNRLNLLFEDMIPNNMKYELFDMQGKLLQQAEIDGSEMSVDMSKLTAGAYFLKIKSNDEIVKVFKIIKH